MLWVREGELMENVKLACSAALALTRADCGVTPAVLPWACSWNPISLLRYGACFSSPLWKPCPQSPTPPRLLQTVYHCSNKTWFVFTCDDPEWDGFFGSQAGVAHLFNHIRPFLLPAPKLGGDRKVGNKLLFFSLWKRKKIEISKCNCS